VFIISPAGKAVLKSPPISLDTKFLLTLEPFKAFYNASKSTDSTENAISVAPVATTPEETIESALGTINAALRADLLDRIIQNKPAFFEGVIVDLLVAMGYGGSRSDAAQQLGKSGDGGVDGVINEDVLGLDRVYVQAKRYAVGTKIGRPEIQTFTGSLVGFNASKGVFVTTSSFSQHALDFAQKIPQSVVLIDGSRLTELMIENGVGVRTSRTVEIRRIDEDFFSED
jgi:restriction system protein